MNNISILNEGGNRVDNTDEIKKKLEKNKKLLTFSVSVFNCTMLFIAACLVKVSKFFALLMVILWLVLLVCIIVLNRKVKKSEKILKNVEKE